MLDVVVLARELDTSGLQLFGTKVQYHWRVCGDVPRWASGSDAGCVRGCARSTPMRRKTFFFFVVD